MNIRSLSLVSRSLPELRGRHCGLLAIGMMAAAGISADVSSISIASASGTVLNGTGTTISFPVTRSGDSSYAVALSYATQDGSAIAGTDYTATAGTVTIPGAGSSATITVPVTGEAGAKTDKQFFLKLLGAAGVRASAFEAPSDTADNVSVQGLPATLIATADFNGDGKLDLLMVAAPDIAQSVLEILLNTTVPGATAPSYSLFGGFGGSGYRGYAVGDFNGDGKPDVAVVYDLGSNPGGGSDQDIAVFLNTTPAGTNSLSFASPVNFSTGLPANESCGPVMSTGDFNGDGKTDLAVVNCSGAAMSILLNTATAGAATPAFAAGATFPVGSFPESIAVGDFNGDGRPDVVTANGIGSTLSVLLNTTQPGAATPSFSTAVNYLVQGSPVVMVADMNGDGRPDLVAANSASNSVSILFNITPAGAAAPSFTAAANFPLNATYTDVVVADFNGDGRPDLLVGDGVKRIATALLNTIAPGALAPSFATGPQISFGSNTLEYGYGINLLVTDANFDGKPDIAAISMPQNSVSILVALNTTASATKPTFSGAFPSVTVGTNPQGVVADDFHGDGKQDLAVANYSSNSVSVLLNTTPGGATTSSYAAPASFPVGTNPQSVASADFNGDGKPDLAVANFGDGTVSVLLNTSPPGAATPSYAAAVSFTSGTQASFVAAADLNGDGKPDLAVTNFGDGTVSVLFNTTPPGAATPSFAAAVPYPTGTRPLAVAIRDLNADGMPDLAVTNQGDGNVAVLLNKTAAGASTPSFAAAADFAVSSGPLAITTGDFNADGRPDLAVATLSGNVSVLLNTTTLGGAAPTFAPVFNQNLGGQPAAIAVGDFNGDGSPDLAIANQQTNQVSVLLNTTAGGATTPSFAAPIQQAVGSEPSGLAVADFNGDGKPDLAAANFGANSLSVLLNSQYQISISATPTTGTIQYQSSVPGAFSFTPVTNANPGAVVTSSSITVSGTNIASSISVSGGQYSIDNAAYTSAASTVQPGSSVTVQLTASTSYSTQTQAVLTIGGTTGAFTVTTRAPVTTPNAFSFTPVTGAPPDTAVVSNTITVTGIEVPVPISVNDGVYAIIHDGNVGAYTASAGTVDPGDQVMVKQTSSPSFSATTSVTLNINGTTGSFSVSTEAAITAPTAFSFSAVTGAAISTVQTSNAITVSGTNAAAPISISGGSYSVNGLPYQSAASTVNAGDSVTVQVIASSSYSTTSQATLSIGGVSAVFRVTTTTAPATGGSGGGSGAVSPYLLALLALGSIARQWRRRGISSRSKSR